MRPRRVQAHKPAQRIRAAAGPARTEFPWGPLLARIELAAVAGAWPTPSFRERRADPFKVLVTTVLSHRSRDSATEKSWHRLSALFPNAGALARADPVVVARLIDPSGLSSSRATGVVKLAKDLHARFGDVVPTGAKELDSLPMVGPKTAEAVRVFAFGLAGIPVDTHIHRIANRLGVVETETPEATWTQLRSVVPRRFWRRLNPTLVQLGQNVCLARAPRCASCPVSRMCPTGSGSNP